MTDDNRPDSQIFREDPFRTTRAGRDAGFRYDSEQNRYAEDRRRVPSSAGSTASAPAYSLPAGPFLSLILGIVPGFLSGLVAASYVRGFGPVAVLVTIIGVGLICWIGSAFLIYHFGRILWNVRSPVFIALSVGALYWFYTSPATINWRGQVTAIALVLATLSAASWLLKRLWKKSRLLTLMLAVAAAGWIYRSQPRNPLPASARERSTGSARPTSR